MRHRGGVRRAARRRAHEPARVRQTSRRRGRRRRGGGFGRAPVCQHRSVCGRVRAGREVPREHPGAEDAARRGIRRRGQESSLRNRLQWRLGHTECQESDHRDSDHRPGVRRTREVIEKAQGPRNQAQGLVKASGPGRVRIAPVAVLPGMALLSARQILISAIVAFVWNVSVSPASACDCAGRPTCATLWDADLVFVGTVNRIVTTAPKTEEARFTIEEWLRGEPVGKEVTIMSAGVGFSCEYDFAPAGRYLVFARKAPDGSWKAALCGGTTPIESKQGQADLAEIKAALNSRQPGTVSGEVAFDEDPAERIMPGAPIARTAVRLRSESTTLI